MKNRGKKKSSTGKQEAADARALPAALKTQVFPASPRGPFAEFELDNGRSKRYRPSDRPIGVCISGGGTRSMSAAIGQMRALKKNGLFEFVGAISCVSGGSWFGTLFSYISDAISDGELLGPSIAPGNLTLADIETIGSGNIGAPVPGMTNAALIELLGLLESEVAAGLLPQNRVYARLLNALLLAPFDLDATDTFFALDGASVDAILGDNPDLRASDFLTVRKDRPYFLANATQVFPDDENAVMRHVVYSPLYTGTPQIFSDVGPRGQAFGGGYSQAFAFDSTTPTGSSSPVSVPTPSPIFLLSDVMGSSGAAPGAFLDKLGFPDVGFPEFDYWPAINLGQVSSARYSFVDGGDLEDTGIVSLLYRQYPVIFSFVNAELPIGSDSDEAVDGISGQVSRLFGEIPSSNLGNDQDTQVFSNADGEFAALAAGLKKNRSSGGFFVGTYTIKPDNAFGIEPYPGDGTVTVVWFYLNLNQDWKSAITDRQVRAVLDSSDPSNDFSNFPNYRTVGQNQGDLGIPELLMLSPEQVQLLANMTAFSVGASARRLLADLRGRYA